MCSVPGWWVDMVGNVGVGIGTREPGSETGATTTEESGPTRKEIPLSTLSVAFVFLQEKIGAIGLGFDLTRVKADSTSTIKSSISWEDWA